MSTFVPNNVFLRGVLLHYFNMKKNAADSHRVLVEVYGVDAFAERTCQKWFARFKRGKFDLHDDERRGAPTKFYNQQLEEYLNKNSSLTQAELAKILGVTQAAISHRLKVMGLTRKNRLNLFILLIYSIFLLRFCFPNY